MFQAFYGSVPDIINIGNPMLVGNVVAKSEKDVEEGEFKQAVDDLIKDVFKKDEEE